MGKKNYSASDIKSLVRNILVATPEFPIFCEQLGISPVLNSTETNNLAERYVSHPQGINMPLHKNVRVCTHVKVTGVRCGSPALRGEQFCYFHQRMIRGVPTPPESRLHPIALIENEEAIQASLMEVINALARNTIDVQRAALILKALYIAVINSRRVRFQAYSSSMVKQVPEYAAPPARPVPAPAAVVDECELQRIDPARCKPPMGVREAEKMREHG
jgi:hypothetical protein